MATAQKEGFGVQYEVYNGTEKIGRVSGLDFRECYQKAIVLATQRGVTDMNKVRLDSDLKKDY